MFMLHFNFHTRCSLFAPIVASTFKRGPREKRRGRLEISNVTLLNYDNQFIIITRALFADSSCLNLSLVHVQVDNLTVPTR